MNSAKDIRVSRPNTSSCDPIAPRINAMAAASCPPTDSDIAVLRHRDAMPTALEILKPDGLVDIIGQSLQSLLPYRVARFFEAIPIRSGCFGIDELAKMESPKARLAQAAIGLLPWCSASDEERRVIITRLLLLARVSS